MIALLILAACDPSLLGVYNPNNYKDIDGEETGYTPSMIEVSGEVRYNSVLQNGVRLLLVNDAVTAVDDDTNNDLSIYQLDADTAGDYWLLAGYSIGTTSLMAWDRVSLVESSSPLENNIDLQSIEDNPAQDYADDSECSCEGSVWNFSFWSCDMESGWAWGECD